MIGPSLVGGTDGFCSAEAYLGFRVYALGCLVTVLNFAKGLYFNETFLRPKHLSTISKFSARYSTLFLKCADVFVTYMGCFRVYLLQPRRRERH